MKQSIGLDGKTLIDRQDDLIDPEVLEEAVYRFVEFYREGRERAIL